MSGKDKKNQSDPSDETVHIPAGGEEPPASSSPREDETVMMGGDQPPKDEPVMEDEKPPEDETVMMEGDSSSEDQSVVFDPEDTQLPTPPPGTKIKRRPKADPKEDINRVIGNYHLVKRIGEGGMGEVFLANQTQPIKRKVAFKIIKKGMDTKELVARFEAERQAVAMMDHINIAKVFDAGATDRGRPFFAMEYVDGVPMTKYCDANKLDTKARLRLFIQVCEGVQHAHQKAIIHRDLKPSNVLITSQDGEAVPKIIDFGIAKAIGGSLIDDVQLTTVGQLMGTPSYMSPEQADMAGADIDTRTDIYSLGVILYELLSGKLPLAPEDFKGIGYAELRRKIQEDQPTMPSTRMQITSQDAEEIASNRGIDVQSLSKALRGDLDWIIMMAIDKDKARRYPSAYAFAADIHHYLNNEPVSARPPSTRYRLSKFIARHKVGVTMAAVVAMAVILGIVGTTVGMVRAIRAERIASREAETARQVSDFLVGLFKVSDPDEARGNSITAREILDEGAKKIEDDLEEQPETQARLMDTIGRVYQSLGLYDSASDLLSKSLELRMSSLGSRHSETASGMAGLGVLYKDQGKYAEAESLLYTALELKTEELGPSHEDVATMMMHLATAKSRLGKYDESDPLYHQALTLREVQYGKDSPEVAETLSNMAVMYYKAGRHQEAVKAHTRALEIREASFGPNHPHVARSLNNLALVYQQQGKYEESIPLYQRALDVYLESLGEQHPHVALGYNNLALAYYSLADYDSAEPLYKKALAVQEAVLGEEHPDVARTLNNLANLNKDRGRPSAAEPLFVRALAIRETALGPKHPDVGWSMGDLGILYREQRKYDQADSLFHRALVVFKAAGDKYGTAWTLNDLGVLSRNRGNLEEAVPLFQVAIQTFRTEVSSSHPDLAEFLNNYALLLRTMGRHVEAEAMKKEADLILKSS